MNTKYQISNSKYQNDNSKFKLMFKFIREIRSIRAIRVLVFILALPGCASSPSILLERQSKRQIALSEKYTKEADKIKKLSVEPPSIVTIKGNIEITVKYATREYLDDYFRNEEILGQYAGPNPYHPWTVVFYIKIANTSGQTIKINPEEFVVVDDMNSQYSYLSPDYIVALYESGASVSSFVKTTADIAPGPYGIPFKLAAMGGASKKRHAILKQVALTAGYLHNNVIYDGYIAFLRPHHAAKKLTLILSNIKLGFDKEDKPLESVDFEFQFDIRQ